MKPMPDQELERMRQLALELEQYGESGAGSGNGIFMVRRKGAILRIIASQDPEWEHVSVSLENRCPSWDEMSYVKDLFFRPDECVMQLHPPKEELINNYPYCLHLWRPMNDAIPMPPAIYVGVKSVGVLNNRKARRLLREGAS